ncbi:lactate utilization protein [Ruminococcaceae bacterium OttesenSCG-928-A16]|nr:lactate utilization protein [Ruminococcaceae bacterium OttesenSCG-928-A16]
MDYTTIRENFEKHGFATQLFATKQQVKDYFINALQNRAIGFGGSVTLRELGLFEALSEQNAVAWHNKVNSFEVRRLANHAQVYITSANAVSQTGEIVNIDGTGNRVAMTAFGPEVCYYVVGKNKIVPTFADALHRCKHVAAPLNAKRLSAKTPCAVKGDKCYDCSSPGRICRITTILDRAPFSMKSEIIFVDEELGL